MASSSNFHFWFKWILVMIAVMLAALAFLILLPAPGQQTQSADTSSAKKANIADSMNRFYTEFRAVSKDPIKERYGDYTIMLDDTNETSLAKRIEEVTSKRYEPMENWQGEVKQRNFAINSTIMQEAVAHAAKEGVTLIWDLNQDFTILHRFNSNNSIAGMLEELAGAVDSNFDEPINIYYCEKKRVYVVTTHESRYVIDNCVQTKGS